MAKGLAHEIASDYLRVAAELGRQPLRDEYLLRGAFSKHTIVSTFGSWTNFLQASGLQHTQGKRNKQEIRKEYHEKLVEEANERRVISSMPIIGKNILVIGDLHVPYQHPDAISFLLALNEKYKFDLVCSVGDEIDGHALSFHDHDPDLLSPGHELDAAIRCLEPLYKAFPRMEIAESNHGSLVFRKAKHHGIPRQVLKSYREAISAPDGWRWHPEIKLQDNLGNRIIIHHSYSVNVRNASLMRGKSLVQGHHHTRHSIDYWADWDAVRFGAFTGCLIDDAALAMAYNKNTLERPCLGSLRITDGVPHLLPMILDKNGRWNGEAP